MAYPADDLLRVDTAAGAGSDTRPRHVPPRTPYEEAVLAIWRDILGDPHVGVFDDFFEAGGHSLLVTKVVSRIRKVLGVSISVREFFETPTVERLAARVGETASIETRAIDRRPADADPVLSFDQERLWLEHQIMPGAAYNVHVRRRLVGPLDVEALAASIRAIVDRHEVLRTRFPVVAGRPVPVVDDLEGWQLDVVDLSGAVDGFAEAQRMMDEDAVSVFDLAEGQLFRCRLVRLGDTEHLLAVTMHHLVADDWSMGVFVRELVALYEAGGDPERTCLPTLPVQYHDVAYWQRRHQTAETLKDEIEYWQRHLGGAPPMLSMPSSPRTRAAKGRRTYAHLTEDDTSALRALCRTHGVTPFMVMLAALATVLRRWSGQSDVVIGVPVAGRSEHGTEDLIGFFVNTLPLRVDLEDAPTFTNLLERVREVAVQGYAHAEVPFDLLVKELRVPRDPRSTPLFQVLLNVLGTPPSEQVADITVERLDDPELPAKIDLTFNVHEADGVLRFRLDYDAERYPAAMMDELLGHLCALMRAVVDDPARGILEYPLGTEAGSVHADATAPPDDPEPSATAHAAVAQHAELPGLVAVIDGEGEWSYEWLHRAADRVVDVLNRHGVSGTDLVGIVRRLTAPCVAAILGCQRAGVSHVLLDTADATFARYLGVARVLDVAPTLGADDDVIDLRDACGDRPTAPHLLGPADTDIRVVAGDWAVDRFDLGHEDRFAPLSDRTAHLLAALSSAAHAGATLVLPDSGLVTDIPSLIDWLKANGVTVVHATTPVLRAVTTRDPHLPALRYAFVENRGDLVAHDVAAVRRLVGSLRVVGVYGAGQDGRPLTSFSVPDEWDADTVPVRVPLGTELPSVPCVLETATGRPVAPGEVGEIRAGSRSTGDLARRWPDGSLEYVGRVGGNDTWYLDELVMALRGVAGLRDAVVTERAAGNDDTVVAYLVGPDTELDAGEIRRSLMGLLPDFLVPEHLLLVDELPVTTRGDYDLSGLPVVDTDPQASSSYLAPRTPMEHRLTEMLQELLDLDRVGIRDNFFELGGFSLLATRLVARMRDEYKVDLSLRDVFQSPTVEGLAQATVRAQGELLGPDGLDALLAELDGS